MVERAFSSANNYLEFFKEIDDIYTAKDDAINNIFVEINLAYRHLLQDDEKSKKPNEFLVPEIPKNKKDTKDKSESRRVSRKKTSTLNETADVSADKVESMNDPDAFRRSSRIASKKILPRVSSTSESIGDESSINASRSPTQSLNQSKQKFNTKNKNSTNTEDSMKFLAHSTPLTLSPFDEKNDTNAENKTPNEKIAPNLETEQNPGSVKKRVAELEKRVAKGILPSKLPLRTPDKKKNMQLQDEKPLVDNAPVCKSRLLRSNRALKDKNVYVEAPQSQAIEVKKPARFKNNITGNKVKTGINSKATNQRPNETDENSKSPKLEKKNNGKVVPPKKYFNQIKAKDTKTPKANSSTASSQSDNSAREQEAKQTENKQVDKSDPSENGQYEIDHVLEDESSEDEDCPKKQIPFWATKEIREYPLHVQAWIDKKETVYPWFSNKNIKNPKLEELFSVTIKMRPRTSSAVWNTKTHFK